MICVSIRFQITRKLPILHRTNNPLQRYCETGKIKKEKDMKKLACLFLAIVMTITMLSGCADQKAQPSAEPAPQNSAANTGEKEKVVVACWGNQMLDT